MTIKEDNQHLCDNYNFKVFDLKSVKIGKGLSITISGKRNSGKTVLLRDLCYQLKDKYSEVYLFSNTASYQPLVFDFIKKENIFIGLNVAKIQELWNAQGTMTEKLLKKNPNPDHEKVDKILILFDDIVGDPKIRTSDELAQLFTRGRHVYISQIFLTQSVVGIPPIMRRNVDLAIAFYLEKCYC